MFYLVYRVLPAKSNLERELLGEAFVGCWIVRRSLAEADKVCRREIKRQKWRILERESGNIIRAADYDDGHDGFQYYRQARIEGEVFVFHLSPRFPEYWVAAAARDSRSSETAEAHFFLAGDAILKKGEDLYDPDFWSGQRERIAVKAARDAIKNAGWKMASISNKCPCGADDLPKFLQAYYDKAEDAGSCLVFVHGGKVNR
jgi:hypothetical protein